MKTIKNMIVIGGGTAGWLTALFAQKVFKTNITVIESSDIGILGAGEGSTTHILQILEFLDISVEDVVKNANGTFKNGIKFTNWSGDKKYYYHNFNDNVNLFNSSRISINEFIAERIPFNGLNYSSLICDQYKAKFTPKERGATGTLNDFFNHGSYSLHFDAHLLAKFLKNVGLQRNIKIVDDKVTGVKTDKDGFITDVILEKASIGCDFLFDCSGFHRLVIGKHFNSNWVDYTSYIPNTRALPFFLENNTSVVPPYTESIAMKYGWVWKIPVQKRFGCGYVLDSKKISDEDAKKELEDYFKQEITIPRAFNFSAGCFKETWVKNCIAIGLSTGFIEPLEATSIWVIISSLSELLENLPGVYYRDQEYINVYNKIVAKMNSDVLDFIYLHYVTKRKDTTYWKNFTEENQVPIQIKKLLNALDKRYFMSHEDFKDITKNTMFGIQSFTDILHGLELFNSKKAFEHLNCMRQPLNFIQEKEIFNNYISKIKNIADSSIDHYSLLQYLKNES